MAMFDTLTAQLSRALENLRGRGRITEDNVAETLRRLFADDLLRRVGERLRGRPLVALSGVATGPASIVTDDSSPSSGLPSPAVQ